MDASQQWFARVAHFMAGCFHELRTELPLEGGQACRPLPSATGAEFLAGPVKFQGVVLRHPGQFSGADKLDDLLGQPDGMHQLGQGRIAAIRLTGPFAAVLLDPLIDPPAGMNQHPRRPTG